MDTAHRRAPPGTRGRTSTATRPPVRGPHRGPPNAKPARPRPTPRTDRDARPRAAPGPCAPSAGATPAAYAWSRPPAGWRPDLPPSCPRPPALSTRCRGWTPPGAGSASRIRCEPGATRKCLQARPNERFEIAAVFGFSELHLLAKVQNLERAGFELADLCPRICLGRPVLVLIRRNDRIVRAGLSDEPGDHRREFLA